MSSLVSQILQELQKNPSVVNIDGKENDFSSIAKIFEGMSDLKTSIPSTTKAPNSKRNQVPKACSNCRKMHAACDMERPCRRCINAGVSDSCFDIPRKKRASKKRKSEEETIAQNTNQNWEENFQDFFQSQQTPISPNMSSNGTNNFIPNSPSQAIELYNPLNFQNDTSLLPDLSQENFSPSSSSSLTPPPLTPNSAIYSDMNFLIQQIADLKNSNQTLENKLSGLSQELLEIRKETKLVGQISTNVMSGWHSFAPQSELAVSIWKPMGNTICSGNILLECNNKFVDLVGYPTEVLRENFFCSNLIRREDLCEDNKAVSCRNWPKRTKIITANGMKEVFITISPIHEGANKSEPPKYFLMYILEVN